MSIVGVMLMMLIQQQNAIVVRPCAVDHMGAVEQLFVRVDSRTCGACYQCFRQFSARRASRARATDIGHATLGYQEGLSFVHLATAHQKPNGMEHKKACADENLACRYFVMVVLLLIVVVVLVVSLSMIVAGVVCRRIEVQLVYCWQQDNKADANYGAGSEKVENIQMSVDKSLDE